MYAIRGEKRSQIHCETHGIWYKFEYGKFSSSASLIKDSTILVGYFFTAFFKEFNRVCTWSKLCVQTWWCCSDWKIAIQNDQVHHPPSQSSSLPFWRYHWSDLGKESSCWKVPVNSKILFLKQTFIFVDLQFGLIPFKFLPLLT